MNTAGGRVVGATLHIAAHAFGKITLFFAAGRLMREARHHLGRAGNAGAGKQSLAFTLRLLETEAAMPNKYFGQLPP